jgi:hypothetical protein
MKKIQTDSKYFYGNNVEVFTVPPFSEIKKVYINGDSLFIIYEYPIDMEFHNQRKLVTLKVQESISAFNETGYQYLDTQIIQKTELVNSSSSYTNIQINIQNLDIFYHFFIQEIKPPIEIRDSKIEKILDE